VNDDNSFFSVSPARTPVGVGNGLPLKGKSVSKMFKTPGRRVNPSGATPKVAFPKPPKVKRGK